MHVGAHRDQGEQCTTARGRTRRGAETGGRVDLPTAPWANDVIHKHGARNGNHSLYEAKVYSSLCKLNLGTGTSGGGGSPSTSAGDLVTFGCTEEWLLADIYGCKERGSTAERRRAPSSTTRARAGCRRGAAATTMAST